MNAAVKAYVDAKTDFLNEYFTIPKNIQSEVNSFISETTALGEICTTALEFEERFIQTGLLYKLNVIIPKCIPKSRKMTYEEKKKSWQTTKDIVRKEKDEFIDYAVDSVKTAASAEATSVITKRNRERMLEDGTMADYTNITNRITDIEYIIGLFKKKRSLNSILSGRNL